MSKASAISKLFNEFFESERASGLVLVGCTIVSLLIANSTLGPAYAELWHTHIGFDLAGLHLDHSMEYWINDGLMAIFFLLIGLEIERELYVGKLSNLKNAALPIFAALGGMLMPALLHFLLNRGTATQAGMGIPMATDIAFALAVLALLGNRVPLSLKVFLTALAIIDDLGAIIVIALFYTHGFSALYLGISLAIFAILLVMNRLGVRRLAFYLVPGVLMWYFMLQSGVHATLSGVLLAFAVPFAKGGEDSPSYKLQHFLHRPVAFLILPLFALANTGITLGAGWANGLLSANSIGIFLGLFAGKPLGIVLMCLLTARIGWTQLPADLRRRHLVGAGFLGGIGFTMAIFVSLLAFDDPALIQGSKISVLITSLLAGAIGYVVLRGAGANPVSQQSA